MASGRMRRRLLGAALPLALVLVPAAALAVNLGDAGGVSYRFQAKHAAANHPADAVAACPKKKSPTGGGYQFSGDMGMTLDQPAASKPFDGPDSDNRPDDGWEVRGQVNDGASALSFAMCTKGEKRYVANDHGAFGRSQVTADCPGPRWHVTGGGGSLGKPESSTLIASFPIDGHDTDTKPDDGWEAWGYAQPQDRIHAFAVCSRKKPVYREVTETLDPGFGSRNEAMCGDGHHLLGVGGRLGSDPSQTARVFLATPDDFNRDQVYDDAGAMFGQNDLTAQDPVTSTVDAICTR